MVLVAILFCLALQRFANVGGWFQASWFELYLKNINPWITKLNEWVAIVLIIAPILLFLALLHFLFAHWLFGLFNLVLATIVLFFCIDARDFKNRLAVYFNSLEKNNVQAAVNAVADLVGDVSSNDTTELNRAITKTILLDSFERLFAGLFWFMLFGTYGVATYFLIVLLRKHALKISSNHIELVRLAAKVQDTMDWIPSRLVGVSYSLVGNFNKGFNYCHKHLWCGLSEVKKFAVDAGIAALDIDLDINKATVKENYATLDLINRVLIIWLISLFLVLLGILL